MCGFSKHLMMVYLIGCLLPSFVSAAEDAERFAAARARLVENIQATIIETSRHIGVDRFDSSVMAAMRSVKRHRFVPRELIHRAYRNAPLPIGYGQTISQPYIVALMSHMLELKPGDRVLEVGTGSGYQAAILAEMGMTVYSIEIIGPLAKSARKRLRDNGYSKATVKIGDGYFGWEEEAPFDGIIVTAAAGHVPPPLISQLKDGGNMVIPVGGVFSAQQLVLVSKDAKGSVTTRQLLPVRFVPLTRQK